MKEHLRNSLFHHISANGHICRYGAVMLIRSIDSLELSLTECCNLVLLQVSLPKNGGCTEFPPEIEKLFGFDLFQF